MYPARHFGKLSLLLFAALLAPSVQWSAASGPPPDSPSPGLGDGGGAAFLAPVPEHEVPCVNGNAGGYPCHRVDLLEVMPLTLIGGGNGNDCWGWTDPQSGKEYALMGRTNGTAFIDVSDPEAPIYLGNLPTQTSTSLWRDIKVYANHAFIVSEASGHGMQVFDLTQLRSVASPPATFSATAHYSGFGNAHNVAINEATGFAYAVGTGTCSGGLHMVNIQNPLVPVAAGCVSNDGYTHDTQCVVYAGPDVEHTGKEICFSSNTDTLTIADVTNKATPVQLSRTGYAGFGYTHQGWLTADQRYFLVDDELDELNSGHNTRTYVWDLADLDAPQVIGAYTAAVPATDHNLYVHEGFAYLANYRSGLRVLSLDDVANGNLSEVGFFDTYPPSDAVGTGDGAWTAYPFFASGIVIISTQREGMFIVRPVLCSAPATPMALTATGAGDNTISLGWSSAAPPEATFDVDRALGACPGGTPERIATGIAATAFTDTTASGQVTYSYTVRSSVEDGLCVSASSDCAEASTTGPCTAPPSFSGLGSVTNPASSTCALDLAWSAANASCGGSTTYSIYRSNTPDFEPSAANRIASGLTATTFRDLGVRGQETYSYVVRATDGANSTEDVNRVERSGAASGPISDGPYGLGAEIGDDSVIYGSGAALDVAIEHMGWEFATNRLHGGARSYYSTYFASQCLWFATQPLALTASEASQLSFWTLYDIESQWDGGVVQISTDGGTSWSALGLDQGYPGTFRQSSDACGFATGAPAFTGTNLTWTRYTANLSAFAGQTIQVRFIFSTDGAQQEEGWYVDDVQIDHVALPGPCVGELFQDGFESGTTGAWSTTQP